MQVGECGFSGPVVFSRREGQRVQDASGRVWL